MHPHDPRKRKTTQKYQVFAVAAPSISSQFHDATVGQVVAGIKALGFFNVVEAALGADMVAWQEARELAEKGFLTSSCCPAFVQYIRKSFPDMAEHISHNLSPMGEIARYIKQIRPGVQSGVHRALHRQKDGVPAWSGSKTWWIASSPLRSSRPCLTARASTWTQLEGEVLDNASYYGRMFARSGGLADGGAKKL